MSAPHNSANHLLKTVADTLQVSGLEFDESNQCRLVLDGKIPLLFYFNSEDSVLITTVVIDAIDPRQFSNHADLLFEMLAGNYCWSLTGGGTLAVDEETGVLVLNHLTSLEERAADPDGKFADTVSALTTAAEYWIDRVAALENASGNKLSNPTEGETIPVGIRI